MCLQGATTRLKWLPSKLYGSQFPQIKWLLLRTKLSIDSTQSWQESKAISQFSQYKPTQKFLCLLLVLPVSWGRKTYFYCPWTLVLFPCNHAEVIAKAIKILKEINLWGDAWEPSFVSSSCFAIFKHRFYSLMLTVNIDRTFQTWEIS